MTDTGERVAGWKMLLVECSVVSEDVVAAETIHCVFEESFADRQVGLKSAAVSGHVPAMAVVAHAVYWAAVFAQCR